MFQTKESAQLLQKAQSDRPTCLELTAKYSAFKMMLLNFLQVNGDPLKLDKKLTKTLRVGVKDVLPQFVLTDGQFNISGYITKEAYDDYNSNPKNTVKIENLKDYMLNLERWTIDLVTRSVNENKENESFTSYAGLEMRLVITKMSQYSDNPVELPNKYSTNLYRDPVVAQCINSFIESQMKVHLDKAIKKQTKPVDVAKLLPKESDSKVIKVKTDTSKPTQGVENSLSIDGEKTSRVFTSFSCTDKSKFELITMEQIIEEGKKTTNKDKKVDLKAMVKESKERTKKEIYEDEAAYASTVVRKSARSNKSEVKTKTTLKLGKGKAEITTEIKKVPVKKERSASSKKTATAKKLSAS